MRARGPLGFFLLASLLIVGCGVPISAADLTLTPETSPTPDDVTLVVVSSRGLEPASTTSAQALSAGNLTPQASLTARPSASPAASRTAGPTLTSTPTAAPSATATTTPVGTPPPTQTPSAAASDLAAQALAILNKYRTDSGRPALRMNAALAAADSAYAKVMGDNSWFTCGCDPHTGPDGSQSDQRVYQAGYTGRWKGEALAAGQSSPQAVIDGWLNSPAHAAIVLDPSAVDVGIGFYYKPGDVYGYYWVLSTGVP